MNSLNIMQIYVKEIHMNERKISQMYISDESTSKSEHFEFDVIS